MLRKFPLVLSLLFLLLCTACTSEPTSVEGEVSFQLEVVHGDGTHNTFDLTATTATLGEALVAEGLIAGEDSAYGLFVQTVDGETADTTLEQWWCLTKNGGVAVATGVDSTPLCEGERYELTLHTGW